MLPERLFDAAVNWLRNIPGASDDLVELRETEQRLGAHLHGLGVLPATLPCGCCEVVGVAIIVGETAGQTVVDLQPVRRRTDYRLH